jgi:hypothetical protein
MEHHLMTGITQKEAVFGVVQAILLHANNSIAIALKRLVKGDDSARRAHYYT